MKRTCIWLISIFLVSAFLTRTGHAQELYGQISGTVLDTTGAVVPGARVTARNTGTGIVTTGVSADNGTFTLLHLTVGNYTLTVSKEGFKVFSVTDITVNLNRAYTVQATLQPGQVSQTVEVNANAAQVETTTTQLDTVIGARTITDLPLNGRNWTQLQQLAPGVEGSNDRFGLYATNGSQTQQNSYLINGADSVDQLTNTPGFIPSPDAIQEFNLITSTINAEYSRNSGAILNAVIKNGTNQFHGSGFEFYRDTFLNAHNYFQTTAPVFHQNQFGGTVGGPIWKNHTFFFFSYQGTRARQPQSGYGHTPVLSDAERGGDFSDGEGCPFGGNVSPTPLQDSNGNTQPAGTPYCDLFPTGVIPSADFNSISTNLLGKFVPHANASGNFYNFSPITTVKQDQEILRIDHTFGPSDSLWGSMYLENYPTSDTLTFVPYGATLPGFGSVSQDHNKSFTVDWTHILNPSTLNEFRLAYLRVNQVADDPQAVAQPSSFGFTGITPQNSALAGLPYISLGGLFSIGNSEYGPQIIINQEYELADNFSHNVGNHVLKFGFDGTRYDLNYQYVEYNSGVYGFGGTGTFSTGNPGADFLLGFPDSYGQYTPGILDVRAYEYYAYAQDSWRLTHNLTLNYGLGYQVDTPTNNFAFGGLGSSCFVAGQQSQIFSQSPVGMLFPGDKGCTKSGYNTNYKHFGPRFGFAYSPGVDKKLAIRGGFGVYYNRNVGELRNGFLNQVPFSLYTAGVGQIGGSPSFADPWTGWAVTDGAVGSASYPNPYPFVAPKPGDNVDFTSFEPIGLIVTDPKFQAATGMNYNLNVQHELPGAMVFQAGYVAALGRHLNRYVNLNPISLAGAAACIADPYCYAYYHFYQQYYYPDHFQIYPGDILSSISQINSTGSSSYHSLQVSVNKRLTHGLSFLAAYTWSHAIDNGSGYEDSLGEYGAGLATTPYPSLSARDIGDSTFDARNRLVVSYDYQIPGINRFVNNKAAKLALSGWHVAGITTLQSGFPFEFTDSNDPSYTTCGCVTADQVGAFKKLNPRDSPQHYYFDPSAFQEAAIGTFGNVRRDAYHGPGINNTDALLAKHIPFGEGRYAELRLEGYNVFNHTQFGAPYANLYYGSYVGQALSASNGRVIQLGGKFYF